MYHGWADQQISPFASLDFYQQIVAEQGQARTDGFLRLFMLPGIYHCSGGPGAGNFGAAGPATKDDAQHDIVKALDVWVTQRKAPDVFIGTHLNEQTKTADRTRPLCPFPQVGEIQGQRRHQRRGEFYLRGDLTWRRNKSGFRFRLDLVEGDAGGEFDEAHLAVLAVDLEDAEVGDHRSCAHLQFRDEGEQTLQKPMGSGRDPWRRIRPRLRRGTSGPVAYGCR